MTIERTVGTGVGADHENWLEAYNHVIAQGILSENYDYVQVGNIVQPAGGWVAMATPNGRRIRFICPFADSNQGDPTRRFSTTIGAGVLGLIPRFPYPGGLTSGIFEMNGLKILCSNGSVAVSLADCYGFGNQIIELKNSIINGLGTINQRGVQGNNERSWNHISNIKIYNCPHLGYGSTGGGGGGGDPYPASMVNVIENMVVYNCGVGIYAERLWDRFTVFRNVVSCGCPTDWMLIAGATPNAPEYQTTYNCADSDGTLLIGSNQIHNIVPADEFKSLDDTNSKFLFLNDGSFNVGGIAVPERGRAPLKVQFTDQTEYSWPEGVLASGGTEPTLTDTDIEGLDVPSPEGIYSIGCHQAQII